MRRLYRAIQLARLTYHRERRHAYALLVASLYANTPPRNAPKAQLGHWRRAVRDCEGKLEHHRAACRRLERRYPALKEAA